MLDLKWIRDNSEGAVAGLKAKGVDFDMPLLLETDKKRRALLQETETLKAQRNKINEEISRRKKTGQSADELLSEGKIASQKIKELDDAVGGVERQILQMMLAMPNVAAADVPVAPGPLGNKVVRTWGEPRTLSFAGLDHLDLGAKLGWFSMDWGSKISGAGFPVYCGEGARLERGLINFMLDLHVKKHGYKEIWPPALVNRQSMTGTGQLPKMEEDMYRLKDEDFFLIPTAEVPVTNLLRDEILDEKDLPVRFTAYSPCFRREAGSYGKDTRGLSRVHQFDKIEMVKFVRPEDGPAELESLVSDAEEVLQALELPYRVVMLGTGDLSFAAAKCYDLEVWAPVTQKWFEVSSCSWFSDFQGRRANIRFRRQDTKKVEFVHTLNGSGVALARTVLCLLENFQTPDGRVDLPKALKTYLS